MSESKTLWQMHYYSVFGFAYHNSFPHNSFYRLHWSEFGRQHKEFYFIKLTCQAQSKKNVNSTTVKTSRKLESSTQSQSKFCKNGDFFHLLLTPELPSLFQIDAANEKEDFYLGHQPILLLETLQLFFLGNWFIAQGLMSLLQFYGFWLITNTMLTFFSNKEPRCTLRLSGMSSSW